MQRISTLLVVAIAITFTACKGHSKKIIVYATGDIKADAANTNITIGDGTAQREKDLDFPVSDPVTLNIQSPAGKVSLQATEDGLYIANLKNDTIIGSYQRVGESGDTRITQDALKLKLDSLQKLVANQNVNAANRNYFILPNTISKITSETRAKAFGPYVTIPGSFDAGSVPEIYKFYSIKEIREIITKLNGMTGTTPKP